jgi:hypothetical protein
LERTELIAADRLPVPQEPRPGGQVLQ